MTKTMKNIMRCAMKVINVKSNSRKQTYKMEQLIEINYHNYPADKQKNSKGEIV